MLARPHLGGPPPAAARVVLPAKREGGSSWQRLMRHVVAMAYAVNAQLHAGRLDQELAEGADPAASAILRTRARQLTSRRPNVSFSSAVPTQKREILRAEGALAQTVRTATKALHDGA